MFLVDDDFSDRAGARERGRAGGDLRTKVATALALMGDDSPLEFLARQLVTEPWMGRVRAASAILCYYDLEGKQ